MPARRLPDKNLVPSVPAAGSATAACRPGADPCGPHHAQPRRRNTATADPSEVHDADEAVKAEADAEIEASSFRTIWRVLRALAAHDARVVGRITELRASRSQGAAHTTTTESAEGGAAGAGEGEQPAALVESPMQHASRILQTVKLRASNPRAVEWQRMHAVAARFHIEHGHPDPTDKTRHAELVSWLTRQRHLHGQHLLDPAPCLPHQIGCPLTSNRFRRSCRQPGEPSRSRH
ncbi:helicase associated domain-containing protein [Kitasatospora sp. SC0581]|uniref:helicase associated domain-containing protein n=1 Tax=Kitasatospora sp. SC0581 TaxID=3394360 RepID=UPI003A847886